MATRTWLNVDGNLANTANWSGGVLPTTGDDAHWLRGNIDLTTNLNQFGSTALANVIIGSDFAAKVGHSGAALGLGALTGIIRVDAPQAPEIHLSPTSVSKMIVSNCGNGPYGCYLRGSGTVTELVLSGGSLRVAAASTVNNLRMHGGAGLLEGGATVANAYIDGGHMISEAAIGTLLELGGDARWSHQGATFGNIPTLVITGRAVFEFAPRFNATITTAHVRGGLLDCTRSPDVKTISTLNVYPGGAVRAKLGTLVVTTLNWYAGGQVDGVKAGTTNNYT